MKSRGNHRLLLGAVLLGVSQYNIVNASDDNFLRRNRRPDIRTDDNPQTGKHDDFMGETREVAVPVENNLEDLWRQAALTAELELQTARLLQVSDDMSMVMPSRPSGRPPVITRAPTAKPFKPSQPTRSPDNRPTRVPTPSKPTQRPVFTPRPTRSPDRPTRAPFGGPTQPPSCFQGRTLDEYLFDILVSVSSGRLLMDPTTPQGMAFEHMANSDPYVADPCDVTTIEQRYGLTVFYFSTGGANWRDNTDWLSRKQECEWAGILCHSRSLRVMKVKLQNNNLVGTIPNEIATLFTMERLDLFSNAITGTIPSGVSNLTDLILLDLEENLVTGNAFPDALLEMSSLIAYRVSENMFSGTISTELSRLPNLEQLWVATNTITGEIPTEIAAPAKLMSLFLYDNELLGALPTQLGLLPNLEDLRVSNNFLEKSIPTELFAATTLESLRLELNFFSGQIPATIGNLINLVDFRIDNNSLSGTLPAEIARLTNLENFIVNNNFLFGTIPNVFSSFQRLDFFDASNTILEGPIPDTLFDIESIRIVYLSNNSLTGTIPASYSRPPLLRDLFLDGNDLVGPVPSIQPGELQDLNEFLIQFNFLTGTMPSSVCNLRTDSGNLDDLFADCGGSSPEISCSFPECCNRCFEGGKLAASNTRRQRKEREVIERKKNQRRQLALKENRSQGTQLIKARR